MMLVMMPVMMLVFLYTLPSGLNLYIMASTSGGIIEQYIIRKHIRKQEALEAAAVTPSVKLAGKMGIKKKNPNRPSNSTRPIISRDFDKYIDGSACLMHYLLLRQIRLYLQIQHKKYKADG